MSLPQGVFKSSRKRKQTGGTVSFSDIRDKLCNPPVLAEKDQYRIKFAVDPLEIEAAFKLRYNVFKLEQGKNIHSFGSEGIDRDEFDNYCLQLVVEEKNEKKIVGTSRIHMGPIAMESELGFYSEHEYQIRGLDKLAPYTIEVGRSCVSPEYRNGTVVALLWSGISETLFRSGLRYLTGCVSLENMEPVAGWALYEYFKQMDKISKDVVGYPLEKCRMQRPDQKEIDRILEDRFLIRSLIPPLFKGYIRLGANICGEPVYDRDFGTIDFLILLDVAQLPSRYTKHFNVASVE